jgi:hypothetical protein
MSLPSIDSIKDAIETAFERVPESPDSWTWHVDYNADGSIMFLLIDLKYDTPFMQVRISV